MERGIYGCLVGWVCGEEGSLFVLPLRCRGGGEDDERIPVSGIRVLEETTNIFLFVLEDPTRKGVGGGIKKGWWRLVTEKIFFWGVFGSGV